MLCTTLNISANSKNSSLSYSQIIFAFAKNANFNNPLSFFSANSNLFNLLAPNIAAIIAFAILATFSLLAAFKFNLFRFSDFIKYRKAF